MSPEPRYARPKVMLVDLPDEAVEKVRAAGYRAVTGSLGTPLKVPVADSKLLPVKPNGRVPGYAEQEVVVVQQRAPKARQLDGESDIPHVTEKTDIWSSTRAGVIDSRPLLAQIMAANSQRILDHGGIFIIFCEPPGPSNLVRGEREGVYPRGVYINEELEWSVWDLVPELSSFHVPFDHGEEITPASYDLFDVLAKHLRTATFNCTLDPGYNKDRWLSLARNKYGKDVAGIFATQPHELPGGKEERGLIVLLPQVADPGACIAALLDEVLPALAPRVFPESETNAWLNQPEYELPGVVRLQGEIKRVRASAAEREAELQKAIDAEREQDGWLHDLLAGTGDGLVDAVKNALDELGLQDVKKVDDEEEERTSGRRREDLQVWGGEPVMLVEVKGITNLPREASTLQVWKYFVPRMRQWNLSDIRGLSVINQQRGLPPLERENVHTFQRDVLDNAEEQGFGLVTTLDLFRLVINKRLWDWPEQAVVPLLYENGRIAPVPQHYKRVGAIDGFFEQPGVVVVKVEEAEFAVGDELAFRLPLMYEQQAVESIQHDDVSVDRAPVGSRVGIKSKLTKQQARTGVEVFRVAH